jgi:ubiquinone/menaquinone biosynthesis C-methylase UbiE
MEPHHHHDGHLHHGPPGGGHPAGLAELLDLDAEVLHAYLDEVTTWVERLAGDSPRRILDLGAGTGTGTVALAQRFGQADVIAVDKSEEMRARVRDKAVAAGFADRVSAVQVDLDTAWPAVEPVDLAWAASSLHEMADPGQVLANVFGALRPGGLLAVAEMNAPPRFLPDDIGLGRPGLESRVLAIVQQVQANWNPHPDWAPHLEQAGFAMLGQRTFTIDLPPPHPAAVGRYARTYLRRIRPVVESKLSAADLTALDTLLASDGPASLTRRTDLVVRGARTAWAARRP